MGKDAAAPAPGHGKHGVLAWEGADYGEVLAVLAEVAKGKGATAEAADALVKRLSPK